MPHFLHYLYEQEMPWNFIEIAFSYKSKGKNSLGDGFFGLSFLISRENACTVYALSPKNFWCCLFVTDRFLTVTLSAEKPVNTRTLSGVLQNAQNGMVLVRNRWFTHRFNRILPSSSDRPDRKKGDFLIFFAWRSSFRQAWQENGTQLRRFIGQIAAYGNNE